MLDKYWTKAQARFFEDISDISGNGGGGGTINSLVSAKSYNSTWGGHVNRNVPAKRAPCCNQHLCPSVCPSAITCPDHCFLSNWPNLAETSPTKCYKVKGWSDILPIYYSQAKVIAGRPVKSLFGLYASVLSLWSSQVHFYQQCLKIEGIQWLWTNV